MALLMHVRAHAHRRHNDDDDDDKMSTQKQYQETTTNRKVCGDEMHESITCATRAILEQSSRMQTNNSLLAAYCLLLSAYDAYDAYDACNACKQNTTTAT